MDLEDYVARIEKGRIRMEELEQIKSAALEELDSIRKRGNTGRGTGRVFRTGVL